MVYSTRTRRFESSEQTQGPGKREVGRPVGGQDRDLRVEGRVFPTRTTSRSGSSEQQGPGERERDGWDTSRQSRDSTDIHSVPLPYWEEGGGLDARDIRKGETNAGWESGANPHQNIGLRQHSEEGDRGFYASDRHEGGTDVVGKSSANPHSMGQSWEADREFDARDMHEGWSAMVWESGAVNGKGLRAHSWETGDGQEAIQSWRGAE